MSKSIREQLQEKLTEGKLTVVATAKPVKTQRRASQTSQKPASATATTKKAPPKAAVPWYVSAAAHVISTKSSASALGVMKSVAEIEISERLRFIESRAVRVRDACIKASQTDRTRDVVTARRCAETVLNYCHTVRDGLISRDVEVGHLPEVSTQMTQHLTALVTSLSGLGHVAVQQTRVEDVMDTDAVKHFRQSEIKLQRTAQTNPTKPAFMVDLPVVGVFTGVVTAEKLLAAGLPIEKLGGYPVLLNQRIIALRTEMFDQSKLDRATYLTRVISRLEESSGAQHNWTLVTDVGMANQKYRVLMYWIMPAAALSAMTEAAGSPLREWGLAF